MHPAHWQHNNERVLACLLGRVGQQLWRLPDVEGSVGALRKHG